MFCGQLPIYLCIPVCCIRCISGAPAPHSVPPWTLQRIASFRTIKIQHKHSLTFIFIFKEMIWRCILKKKIFARVIRKFLERNKNHTLVIIFIIYLQTNLLYETTCHQQGGCETFYKLITETKNKKLKIKNSTVS